MPNPVILFRSEHTDIAGEILAYLDMRAKKSERAAKLAKSLRSRIETCDKPNATEELLSLFRSFAYHDYTTAMSDDHRVYRRGEDANRKLALLKRKFTGVTVEQDEAVNAVHNFFSKKAWMQLTKHKDAKDATHG